MNRQIPIAKPSLGREEYEALKIPLETGWITQGPKVANFEQNFREYTRAKHSIAVTSCTTGLQLALTALGIGPGDEVILPAFTWVASANVVLHLGAKPIFVDVSPHTFNLDIAAVAEKLNKKTKAVMVVHLFGLCVDMDRLKKITGDIPIIEDAACAIGAQYKGKFAGTLGTLASFSFHPRKTITTGEGGMVTTNDDKLAEVCQQIRNHGAAISEEQRHQGPKPYLLPDFDLLGHNYRMTDLQGALGVVQMKRLPQLLADKKKYAHTYNSALKSLPWLRTPEFGPDYVHGYQAYVCYVDPAAAPTSRNNIMMALQKKGISSRPGTHSVPHLNYYRKTFGYSESDFINSFNCELNSIALPLHSQMSKDDLLYVVETLKGL